MTPTTTAQICAAVQGVLFGSEQTIITGVSTDSRTIAPREWFVPLAGERFDGHDYIPMALEKGAAGCFCTRLPRETREDRVYILVEDTKRALRDLAAWYRNQFDIPIVQITGSMGKTTFKELLAGILSQRDNTLKTPGNLNGDIGAPLTLLSLSPEHQAAVIETGMDEFGQIRWLGQAIRPDAAVITIIDDVHLSHFSSREDILRAKAEILENLRPGGLAVLNGDDETGVTIQYMAAELDAGDILLVKRTPIGPDEDAGQLYSRLAELGGEAASEALRLLEEGGAPRTPQVYGPQYQYASMLSREMSPMDWGRPARELVNQVRGLVPWPCAATDVAGVRWKVYRAQEGTETDRIPGTILSAGKAGIEVACGDGRSLLITELQADGGRRMAAADYLRGHPVAVT